MLWVLLIYFLMVVILLVVFFIITFIQKEEKAKRFSTQVSHDEEHDGEEPDRLETVSHIDSGADEVVDTDDTYGIEDEGE